MPPIEAERGKYRVVISANQVVIEARKEDSPFYVKQPVFIENVKDLEDLFIAIGSAVDQYHATPSE